MRRARCPRCEQPVREWQEVTQDTPMLSPWVWVGGGNETIHGWFRYGNGEDLGVCRRCMVELLQQAIKAIQEGG